MNFVRYEKNQIVVGDSNPKRLLHMVDAYKARGYIVSNELFKSFKEYTVYFKIILNKDK